MFDVQCSGIHLLELFKWYKLQSSFSVVSGNLALSRVDIAIVHIVYLSSSKFPGDIAKIAKSIEEENNMS
jgi:hypothetical protein